VPDTPVKIILMPEFQRGVSVATAIRPAARQGPGHLLRDLADPDDWSQEQVDSFLREYNNRMIHLLSIHEAMPGHYLEGAHSAEITSTLRARLRSGLFAEGWAVYTEGPDGRCGLHEQRSAVPPRATEVLSCAPSATRSSTRACTSTAGRANRRWT
jgi:uncharacterized protein (DUF885 family)